MAKYQKVSVWKSTYQIAKREADQRGVSIVEFLDEAVKGRVDEGVVREEIRGPLTEEERKAIKDVQGIEYWTTVSVGIQTQTILGIYAERTGMSKGTVVHNLVLSGLKGLLKAEEEGEV